MERGTSYSTEEFTFHGNAREWFGIWIVNILLSIVTLGIYSAWAKVRTKKYFYQNTHVGGRNFDYHATGKQILIGRIIMLVGIIAFSVLAAIPMVNLLLILLLIIVTPWLLVRSLRFNAQMSSWSNVRFRFTGSKMGAFLVYAVYPFLAAFTLWLAYPFVSRATKSYLANNHSLGGHRLSFSSSIGPFYKAFLAAAGWVVAVTVVAGIALAGTVDFANMFAGDEPPISFFLVFYGWLFLAFFPSATLYNAFIRNTLFDNLTLEGGHEFSSDVRPLELLWIVVTNALATFATLGLMMPWAQIRMARYLADHTTFYARGSLDNFVTVVEENAGALGDAYVDLEGVELGLGV